MKNIKLNTLYFYITFRCNMFCKHCWVNAPYTALKYPEVLNVKEFKKLLKDAVDLGLLRLVITGGEPLLYKNKILDILYIAKEYGVPSVSIETNGFLLNKELVLKLSKFRDFLLVGVSLDFLDKKKFDEFRGTKGAFEKVTRNIKILTQCNINTGVLVAVYKDNLNEIKPLSRFVLEILHANTFKINPCMESNRADIYIGKEKLLDPNSLIKLSNLIKSLAVRYPRKIGAALPPALVGYWTGPTYCLYKHIAGVLPTGDVTVCAMFGFHGFIAGNIREDRFKELFINSDIFIKIRKLLPKDFGGVCSRCIFAQYCANACPAYALDYYGRYNAPFPICQILYENNLFPNSFLR